MGKLIVLAIILVFVILGIINRIRNKKKIINEIKDAYGYFSDREYSDNQLRAEASYFINSANGFVIDDTTYNDLDMKLLYKSFNASMTSIGSEYSYFALRTPEFDDNKLSQRDTLAKYFTENDKKRVETQYALAKVGRLKEISMSESIKNITSHTNTTNALSYLLLLALVITIGLSIYNISYAPFSIMVMFGAVIFYYLKRSKIKLFFIIFKYIIAMLKATNKIYSINHEALADYNDNIKEINSKLKMIKRAGGFINESNGDLLSLVLEYFYMVTHIDLIAFNIMSKLLQKNLDIAFKMFDFIGEVELAINISSFREALALSSNPQLNYDNKNITFEKLVHPLILTPVSNDLEINSSVLITGSNASGKSTFLKAIALNAIMAQTIYTVSASSYRASYFKVVSSMALRDDIMANESYYIVEIKSLRRIITMDMSIPVLCFVDEILRGTNTVERISASSVILEELASMNCICMAATHDIELTKLLKDIYMNYHFRETITNGDISFDYKLYEGASSTRNAILLLDIIGFSPEIIKKANDMVKKVELKALKSIEV